MQAGTQERNFMKIFHFLQTKVGNYRNILNFLNDRIEDNCAEKGNVRGFIDESRHSSRTELFGEIGGPQEHEHRGNSEPVHYHTKNDIGAF